MGNKSGDCLVKAVTFDLYGTLVDWRSSIGSMVSYLAGPDYIDYFFQCDLESVSSLKSYKPYSQILSECLRRTMEKASKPWRDHYGEAIALSFAKSPPFPDTITGLMGLKRIGVMIAIISNTERRLINITLSGLENLVDIVVTAEDTGIYKPNREAFERAYKILGLEYSEAIHVSSYPQYDLETSRSLGIRSIHLNRYGYKWSPSISSLDELVEILRKGSIYTE